MKESNQLKVFLQYLIKPIINDAVEEAMSRALNDSNSIFVQPSEDKFINLKEATEFLGVARQTIYQNIKRIPHQKRFGKLYFKKSELIAYLEEGVIPGKKKGGKQ